MYVRLEGIFGTALGASATYVYVFILFGAFMIRMGGGDFFIELAQALLGRTRGAAGKVSIFASALFATITGTGPSNAAAVGVVTIPTMIRSGYTPRMAAALEAAASVGGQITPPIMGASAFIMADLLGVPYYEIAKAALLPAIFYFVSLFVTADLEAARLGLKGMRREDLPSVWKTLRDGWHFVVPVGVLIYFLGVAQVSAGRAAAYALLSFVPVWLGRELVAGRRIQLSRIVEAFDESSRSAVMIAVACAVVGIIMNVTDLTGLGLKFTSLIIGYSNDTLIVLLLLTALAAILLGTGLPTTATYLICAILVAPALAKMGVPLLTAHLFVFYFGVVSDLTPPTAVSCYVAGGIAGESGMRVAFSATRVALPALIVPFMFVYSPALMLNGSFLQVVEASVPALLGLLAMSMALTGYWMAPLHSWERGVAMVAGALMVVPGLVNAAVGFAVMAVVARRPSAPSRTRSELKLMPNNVILSGGHTHSFPAAAPALGACLPSTGSIPWWKWIRRSRSGRSRKRSPRCSLSTRCAGRCSRDKSTRPTASAGASVFPRRPAPKWRLTLRAAAASLHCIPRSSASTTGRMGNYPRWAMGVGTIEPSTVRTRRRASRRARPSAAGGLPRSVSTTRRMATSTRSGRATAHARAGRRG
jgi:TRAP transporter 4TM/12TM fusion protein